MPHGNDGPAGDWPVTWAAQRDDQLARTLAATPAQRLAWLEEMIRLAFLTGALPRPEPTAHPQATRLHAEGNPPSGDPSPSTRRS